jgi:hypothetical protein
MTALRLKDQLDEGACPNDSLLEYRDDLITWAESALEEAGPGRIALAGEERPLTTDSEAGLAPLDTELQLPTRNKRKRSRHCCACCNPT